MPAHDADARLRWERKLLLCGVLFGILQTVALISFALLLGPNMPAPGSPAERYAEFYIGHGALLGAVNLLLALPAPLFFLFLGGLYSALRRAGGSSIPLGMAALASGSAMILLWPALPCVLSAITVSAAFAHGDPAFIRAFDELCPALLALSAFPRSVFLFACSTLVLEHRLACRWLGRAGLVVAGATILGAALPLVPSLAPFALASAAASLLWISALGRSLARSARIAVNIYATNLGEVTRAW